MFNTVRAILDECIIWIRWDTSFSFCIYMYSHNMCPKIDIAMLMPSLEIMFCKRALHKNVHIHICEQLFTKAQFFNFALEANFLEWRLTRFAKELFIYFRWRGSGPIRGINWTMLRLMEYSNVI